MSRDDSSTTESRDEALNGASVVLMPERGGACAVLLRALSARGLSPQVVQDEAEAMLALGELAKRGVARRVLIVVEPTRRARLDQLIEAIRGYHTSVLCWQIDQREGQNPMLSQLVCERDQDTSTFGPVGQIRRRTRTVDQLLVPAPGREVSTREVVTQQELTMLLGPAPGEAG